MSGLSEFIRSLDFLSVLVNVSLLHLYIYARLW